VKRAVSSVTCGLAAGLVCLAMVRLVIAQDPYKQPPMPDMEPDGLPGLLEEGGEVTEEESAEELKELLDPGARKREEMRRYRRNLAIYMFTNLGYDKETGYDPRLEAARNMVEFIDEKEIQDLLFERGVKMYFDSSPSYIATCVSAYMKAGTNTWPRLVSGLRKGGSWMIRGRMAEVMQRYKKVLGEERVNDELVRSMRHDPSEDVRGPVAKILLGVWGNNPVPEHVEKEVTRMMYEEDNSLIKYITFWFRNSGDEHLPLFRDILKNGKGWEHRWYAMRRIWSMRYRGGKTLENYPELEGDVVKDLVRATREDPNWRVRFLGVETLFYFENPAAMQAILAAMLEDPDEDIRSYCARMLGFRTNPRATNALIRALADDDPFVRYYAARALGNLDADKSAGAIKGLYDDPERWVADEARKAVARIAGNQ